jgi:DNA-binding MarR family transcriptional regulator
LVLATDGLALPAIDGNLGGDNATRAHAAPDESASTAHVNKTCRAAINGRNATRALAHWAKAFGLAEVEFQILWRLRSADTSGLDQTALAGALAVSPAQISASVERLRALGNIGARAATGDRRRHLWRLSATGHQLIAKMLESVALLQYESNDDSTNGRGSREAAA